MNKKKILWGFISIGIAVLTVGIIAAESQEFSFQSMLYHLKGANKFWLVISLLTMFGYIWFEGAAVVTILRTLGYSSTDQAGTLYGAADVLFSAITPSASGGQPASAFFMMKDGVTLAACTSALLINLVMYTLATLTIGSLCLLFHLKLFFQMSILSRIFIGAGWIIMLVLSFLFYMLLRHAGILYRIADGVLTVMERLRVIRNPAKKRKSLKAKMAEYQQCSDEITGQGRMLSQVYMLNLFQRLSQIGVTFTVFMAMGKGMKQSAQGFVVQALTALGSNSIPIPGGMGGADYLMLDGFRIILSQDSTTMEMLCRGCSFYMCIITSALIVLAGYLVRRRKTVQPGADQ